MKNQKVLWQFGRKVGALVLTASIALASGTVATAQTTASVDPATYHKLFVVMNAFMIQVKDACKSEDCSSLTDQGLQITHEGQVRFSNGLLVGGSLTKFHKDVLANLSQITQALLREADAQEATAKLNTKRALQLCQTKSMNTFKLVEVSCGDVLAAALAVCALYAIASPIAAAICASAAIYGFVQCIKHAPPPVTAPRN